MKRRRNVFPAVLLVIGGFLILGAGLWYGWVVFNQPGAGRQPAAVSAAAEESYPDVPRVSLADAKAAYDTGGAVFLDVRDAAEYAGGHIPGAISIPLSELPSRLGELDPQTWYITYCT